MANDARPGVLDNRDHIGAERAPIPEALNGATLPTVNVPSRATAGQTFTVSGVVGFDCPLCAVDREIRVAVEASHLDEPLIDDVGKLSGRGETSQFSVTVPAPATAGQTVSIRVKAQRNPPARNVWETDNTSGPHQVNILTQTQKVTSNAIETAPWLLGGGTAGVGVARLSGRANQQLPAAALGGAVGLGAKMALDAQQGQVIPDFPTTAVLATAALFGAGALFFQLAPGSDLARAAEDRVARRV